MLNIFKPFSDFCRNANQLIAFLILAFTTPSKAVESPVPFSARTLLKKRMEVVEVAKHHFPKLSYRDRNENRDNLKTFYFADRYTVSFKPETAGTWEDTELGKVWRLGVQSSGAYSLYLTIQTADLVPGTSLFVYNAEYKTVRTVTFSKHKGYRTFSIAPVPGEQLTVELNIPKGSIYSGSFNIKQIYHDRLNTFGDPKTKASPPALCDQPVNCDNGSLWQTEKRAVCKIVTDGALSSGTLLANTRGTKDPYLLTAYHTMFDDRHAEEAIFFFTTNTQTALQNCLMILKLSPAQPFCQRKKAVIMHW